MEKMWVILVGFFVQNHFTVESQSLVIRMFFSVQGGHLLHRTLYDLLLGTKGDVREPFLQVLFLKRLQLKINAKVAYFGVACSEPLH